MGQHKARASVSLEDPGGRARRAAARTRHPPLLFLVEGEVGVGVDIFGGTPPCFLTARQGLGPGRRAPPPSFSRKVGEMLTRWGGNGGGVAPPPPVFWRKGTGVAGDWRDRSKTRIGGGAVCSDAERAEGERCWGRRERRKWELPGAERSWGHPRTGRNRRLGGPGLLFGDDPDDHETCFAVMGRKCRRKGKRSSGRGNFFEKSTFSANASVELAKRIRRGLGDRGCKWRGGAAAQEGELSAEYGRAEFGLGADESPKGGILNSHQTSGQTTSNSIFNWRCGTCGQEPNSLA